MCKEVTKKSLALFLCVTILLSFFPAFTVRAEGVETPNSHEEAIQIIRDGLVSRQNTITVSVAADAYDDELVTSLLNAALAHTGVPTEGDYLQWHLAECNMYVSGNAETVTFTYEVSYYTNAVQEAAVTAQVNTILNELNPTGSDYARIKTVYDWMCNNIVYDDDNLNDDSYTLKHSAYAALVDRKAVCQGYALLLYRLALEMGIDCRIIVGFSNGEAHSWNIVQIDGVYYNLDATWDVQTEEHQYFLKCEGNFANHSRDAQFTTAEFHTSYPMSDVDYEEKYTVHREGNFEYYLYADHATVVKYHGTDAEVAIPATVKGLPVTVIGNEVFYDNDTIQIVTIPASVQSIQDGDYRFDFVNFHHGIGAFRNCGRLETVVIPADSQLSYIGQFAFNNSTLSSITLPSSIRELALSCFEGTQLTELVLPEGLEIFGQNVVAGTKITQLHIPSTCTRFHCFINLGTLESISVAEGNPNYRSHEGVLYAYESDGISGGWGLWIYPKCKPETTYAVPDYCAYIFGDTLAGEDSAPKYLRTMNIGTSKGVAGDFSENSISRLRCEIVVSETNPYYTSRDGMLFSKDMKTLLQVPSNLVGTLTIPEGVETIEECAAEWGSYSTIEIPDTVTSIGAGAFWYTRTLEEIYIPDSVTYIGSSAFQECTSLKTCRLSANLTALNGMTFQFCTSLEYIIIPEGVTTIDFQELVGCENLRYVYIPASVTRIDPSAFNAAPAHRDVFYGGTQEKWNQIDIAESNPYLEGAEYHFETVVDIDEPLELELHTIYVSEIVPPTCINQGHTYYVCSKCGVGYTDDYVEPLEHSFTNYISDGNASCAEDGTKTAFCDGNCGATDTIIDSGSAKGHTYSSDVDGTCNVCGVHRENVEARKVVHMFRMYNPNTGEHFYTGSTVERDNLIGHGWKYEGVGFTFPANTGAPVHRLFQPSTGEHLYTMSETEKNQLMAQGWNYEGIAFNSAYDTEAIQHRLHNPNATVGAYHFTFSQEERDTLIAAGWEYQGIGWYSCWK